MKSTSKLLVGSGLIAAVGSSLCCIVPVIAAIGSISGVAASFSWVEPARPDLIGFTVLALGFAWYQNIRRKKSSVDCDCDDVKPRFWQARWFLGGVTGIAVLAVSFPLYAGVFYPNAKTSRQVVDPESVQYAELMISGMTCTGCEDHVNLTLRNHYGVIEATSSYQDGRVEIKFDESRTSLAKLADTVEIETGYEVVRQELINDNEA